MSKFYIHANFGQNQVIGSGDIEYIITLWSVIKRVLSAVTLKIRSRSQSPNQFSFINKCYKYADLSSNILSCSGDIEHNITFWSKFSVFLSSVTLKSRSRSQSHNQGFSMSKFYIHANFGQNQVIGSGDIEYNITFWSKLSVFCLQ